MITYVNKELYTITDSWIWRIELPAPITCVSQRDCGKTFLVNIIKNHCSEVYGDSGVMVADEKSIISGFEKVTRNKLIVIDNCIMLQSKLGEVIFDSFINNLLLNDNKFLLFNCDGIGIYYKESAIITFKINVEQRIITGGFNV